MSGIVGSKLNIRGSGLVGSLGTDGQNLLSSGAGKTNVFESAAAGGAWTKIDSQTASSDDYITFSTFSTDYIDFRVIGSNVVPETDEAVLRFQISTSSSFLTSGYTYALTGSNSAETSRKTGNDSGTSQIQPHYETLGNASGENIYFEITISDVHDTANQKMMWWLTAHSDSASKVEHMEGGGRHAATTAAVDGIRFFTSSDSLLSGEFTLYGRKVT